MSKVTFDYSKACSFIQEHEMEYMSELAAQAKDKLVAKTGAGNDFLGWIDLPVDYDKEEFDRIKKAAAKIREDSEVLLVIGIGGSYLGARAAIEFLGHSFANVVSKEVRKSPEIYYVGNSISSTYIKDLMDVVGDRDFSINMISKSGTTTEPAIAFRVFKEILEKKYGKEEAAKRIYATTDRAKGALKNLATEEGYETFVVPDDVGGRFSVLTAVGLLPIAVSGADIDKLMEEDSPYQDEQIVSIAGIVQSVKMKTTRSNSMMSYVTIEDDTGSIEMLAFSNVLNQYGGYLREGSPVVVTGRLSLRDNKEPQIVVNRARPISDYAHGNPEPSQEVLPAEKKGTLYLRLPTEAGPLFPKIRAILNMFPGENAVVLFFADTRQRRGTRCMLRESMLQELQRVLGLENVVLK